MLAWVEAETHHFRKNMDVKLSAKVLHIYLYNCIWNRKCGMEHELQREL